MARKTQKHLSDENGEETRQAILRVAHELFMKYGYHAVTTRQLAEACGLTQPALYHHFADKQALYLAMVTEEIAQMKVALDRIARRSEDIAERLKHVATFLLSRNQHDLDLMLHDVRYELSPDARETLSSLFQNGVIAPIAAIFAEGQQGGILREPGQGGLAPFPAAYVFMNLLSRFATRSARESSSDERPTNQTISADLTVQILLYGLASDSKG